jgi:hypothetical protein
VVYFQFSEEDQVEVAEFL